MQNLKVWFILSICFKLGIPFLGKFGPKNQICQFKLKLDTWRIQLTQIWRVKWWCSLFLFLNEKFLMFTFFCTLLCGKFVSKIKIVCLSWNLKPRLTRICRIWWWFSFFILFWVNLVQKFRIISLSWNLVPKQFLICKIQWWCSFFLFF